MEHIYKTPQAELVDAGSGIPLDVKLYKISAIGIATFFGTVFAGGYIAYRNLKNLGRDQQAKKVLVWSAVAVVIVLVVGVMIPASRNIPNIAFTVPQILVMIELAKRWFGDDITQHQQNGGVMASNWKAFGISLLFMIGFLLAVAGVLVAFIPQMLV